MNTFLQDVRYALRTLRRAPGFTAVAVLTLALGIGANTAIFSVVNGVLLHPLPFHEPERLTMVWMDNMRMGIRTDITSYPNYEDMREQSRSFSDLAGYGYGAANLTGDFEPERVALARTTANFFDVLGVQPVLGRAFTEEETRGDGANVAILSHGLWQSRFAGDPRAVGRTIELNDVAYTIIGVMPEDFAFPDGVRLWTPLAPPPEMRSARSSFWLYVVGRLAPGVSVTQAQTEASGIAERLVDAYPQLDGYGFYVQPMQDHLVGEVRPALLVLLGAVGFLLLIACVNVANLLLARAVSREREVAVRSAMGASRRRLIGQLLTEAVVLALVGGVLALPVAFWGVELLKAVAPADLPRIEWVGVDPRVLGFTAGVSVLTGVLCGLIPALHAGRLSLGTALREGVRGLSGGRGDARARSALIVAEVGLALVLLIGAGLLIRSFNALRNVETGFDAEGVLTARVALSGSRYDDPANMIQFWDRLLERIEALPGVVSAAAGSNILLPQLAWSGTVTIEGKPEPPQMERIEVTIDVITPGMFRTIGTPLVRGRDFTERDDGDAPRVAIINQAMADRFWPGEDPIGRRFSWGSPQNDEDWLTIVGVVGNARRTAQDREARPSGYLPFRQAQVRGMLLSVRTSRDPLLLAGPVREAVRATDPTVPVAELATLERLLDERLAQRRLTTLLVAVFSALALLLATIGVYGVISYAVTQSVREIGIRIALGAVRADVLRLVLRRVGVLVGAGIAIGLAGAFFATRVLAGLLYGVGTTDPITFIGAPAILLGTALVAGLVPARRATRVDPMVALRTD
ncbi:MAG TPA: ABC transporter permease [Longimicrobiales bacterium]